MFHGKQVDQLDDSSAGRRLDWLPLSELPAGVKIVVSTLPDCNEFRCHSILREGLGEASASNLIHVEASLRYEKMLEHLLRLRRRTLTQEQMAHVCGVYGQGAQGEVGTPLWLTIVAQVVSTWTSFDGIPFNIKPALRELIKDLLDRLRAAHGATLVCATLAHILLTKGISETELNHVLSLDDDVLVEAYEWWLPPVRIVPPVLIARLLSDLSPYLTRRGEGSGGELISWYHREFWQGSHAWLFGDASGGDAVLRRRHGELADYFCGRWAGKAKPYNEALKRKCLGGETAADRMVPPQPLVLAGALFGDSSCADALPRLNARRLSQLVHHLIKSSQVDKTARELISPEYIAAKFFICDGSMLMREYSLAIREFSSVAAGNKSSETQ